MNERPDDDLISAYLDGELSPAETAEVEKLLAESPEARQLLEDFRALGTGLRGLPKLHLDEGFRDRVLRQAERSTLAGNAWGDGVKPAPTSGGDDSPAVFRFPRTWQGWKWATLATAAALAIWVFGQNALEPAREMARAPAERAPLPPAKFGAAPEAKQELDDRRKEPRAEHFDVLQAPPAEPAVELQETPEMLNRPLAASDSPAAAAPPLPTARRAKAAAEAEGVSPRLQELSAENRKDAGADANAANLADAVELKERSAVTTGVEAGVALGVEAAAPRPEMIAIDVVVPQTEAASEALTQAFLKNRIVLEPEEAAGDGPAASLLNSAQGGAGMNSSPASADFADQPPAAAAAPVDGAEQSLAAAPPDEEQNGLVTTNLPADANLFAFQHAGDPGAQLYYVEATEAQVQQTIEDLKAQPQVFYSVLPLAAPRSESAMSASADPQPSPWDFTEVKQVEDKASRFAEGRAADPLGDQVQIFSAPAKQGSAAELSVAPPADGDPAPAAAARGVAPPDVDQTDRFRAAASDTEPAAAAAAGDANVDLARDEKSQVGKAAESRSTNLAPVQQRVLSQPAQQLGRAYRLSAPQSQRALGRGQAAAGGYLASGRARGGLGYGAAGGVGGPVAGGSQSPAQTRQTSDATNQAGQVAAAAEGLVTEGAPAADAQRTVRAFFFLRPAPALPAAAEPAPAAGDQ